MFWLYLDKEENIQTCLDMKLFHTHSKRPQMFKEFHKDLRAISLLPMLSNILERNDYKQVDDDVSKNNSILKIQSGFRKGYAMAAVLQLTSSNHLTLYIMACYVPKLRYITLQQKLRIY